MPRNHRAIALVISLSILTGCAALRGTDDGWKHHEIVREYSELSQSDIHAGIIQWLPELFPQAGLVIRQSDVRTGSIIAAGVWKDATEYAPDVRANIHFTLRITVIEEEARYRLDSLAAVSSHDIDEGEMAAVARTKQFHLDAEQHFEAMVEKLSTALTAEAADW